MYAEIVSSNHSEHDQAERPSDAMHVASARNRDMAHRLELALNWNKLASELRTGLAEAIERERSESGDKS